MAHIYGGFLVPCISWHDQEPKGIIVRVSVLPRSGVGEWDDLSASGSESYIGWTGIVAPRPP